MNMDPRFLPSSEPQKFDGGTHKMIVLLEKFFP